MKITASSGNYVVQSPPTIAALPARSFWDPEFLKKNASDLVVGDARPGAPEGNAYWSGDAGQGGQYIHAYRSAWLPVELLRGDEQKALVDALYSATRHWSISLHFNKGLAGAPADVLSAARDTAMNRAALDAFALAISAAEGPPAYPTIRGHEPNAGIARQRARAVGNAMDALRKIVPAAPCYVSESDFFEDDWQRAFWGDNYGRLRAVKTKYDPDGLFIVHHGVGSEAWSADGFTRLREPHATQQR